MSTAPRRDLEDRIATEVEGLCVEYASTCNRSTIEACVAQALEALTDAGIEDHAPELLGRFAREILGATERTRSSRRTPPEVLFVCVHNAGRSQMAAALTRHLGGDRVVVRTAGSAPAAEIHPGVVEALAELGLDARREFPKPLARAFLMAADVIVTMGCGDACPVFPGKRYEDWQVPDPAGLPLEQVRPIRDEVRDRAVALLTSLGVEPRSDDRA